MPMNCICDDSDSITKIKQSDNGNRVTLLEKYILEYVDIIYRRNAIGQYSRESSEVDQEKDILLRCMTAIK